MATAVIRLAWDQTSLLWVTAAEPNRDKDKRKEPFRISDVHPLQGAKLSRETVSDGTDLAQWAQIRANYKMTKLNNGKSVNRSRESISPAPGG